MLKMPALRGELQLLSARSEDLRSLCGAFEEASSTLESLRKSAGTAPPESIVEYEVLCREIEDDIIALCMNTR